MRKHDAAPEASVKAHRRGGAVSHRRTRACADVVGLPEAGNQEAVRRRQRRTGGGAGRVCRPRRLEQPVFPPLRPGRTFIFVAPVVEYHHGDAEPLRKQSAVHKLSSGVTVESQVNTDFLRPNFLFKATATRNLIDDTTEQAVSAFASVRVLRNFWPGQPSTDAARHRVLRYFPSIGFEHFRNLAIKNSGTVLAQPFSGSFTSLRLFVQAYPFNRAATPDKIRFSVEADGYIRKPTATSGPFPKAISSVSANATWYFVSEQRVGLGLTGDFGKMPAVNFLPQRRVVLALRFKTP
jgi:hypothetical protein